MPIIGDDHDDRYISEHAAPGIQRTYRPQQPDRSEQSLIACGYCRRTREQCREMPCWQALVEQHPGRHCPSCTC